MIKCIIFDLGNVVLTNDWSRTFNEFNTDFRTYFSIRDEDIVRAWDAHWPDYSIGAYEEDEFWKRWLTEAGSDKIDVEKCKELWRKYQHPINDLFELLERLKKNYSVFALSNISSEGLDFKVEKFGLNRYFDKIIASGKCGYRKPDEKIYLFGLKEFGFKPEECLFIDDKPRYIKPAQELGIKTILFKSKSQLLEDLKNHKILF